MKHDLKSHPQGVTCAACGWVWKTEPVSPCPGLPRFNWWGAPFRPPPEHLKTAGQLYELGFSTGKSKLPVPAAVIRREKSEPHGWMYLYDPSQAAPRKTLTEAQRAHLDAAREKALSRWKCAICGSHLVGKEYWRGVCGGCELNAQLDADRDGAIRAARDLLAHPEGVIILDSETASMHGEIIELAIIDLTGKALFNRRFQPSSDIEPGAAAVHGLTAEILSQEAGWPQLWPQIAGVLGAARLALIYNASYDLGCLTHTCHLHQVTPPTLRTDCLMEWYAQYVGEWSDYHRSYRWQRLPGGDHSALGDCRAGLDVLKAMAAATLKSERTKESLHAAKD